MKKIAIILTLIFGGLILLVGNYLLMAGVFFGPSSAVKAALKSDQSVRVSFLEEDTWLVLAPQAQAPKAGVIFYPENYQDIRTYAPLLRRLAQEGYTIVALSRHEKFPPTFEEEELRIARVRAAFPEVPAWLVGAHTWEASLAAAYANRHAGELSGIILWAGRLSDDSSLANSDLPVLMVYGTLDDQNENLVAMNRPFLPPQTVWVAIEGGNRVNFANFGPMSRDVGATISAEQQQSQAAAATLAFLESIRK
jgi:dienelactone hydrolase